MSQKVNTLNPVHINTQYDRPKLDAGMSGVKLIVPDKTEGLQSYTDLKKVILDYDSDTDIYNFAAAYFSNENSPLFQVLKYVKTSTQSSDSKGKTKSGNDLNEPNKDDSLTNMLKKYYDSGAQYFVMKYDGKNTDDILEASNFIEAQDNKELIVDAPTDNDEPDFNSLANLKGNKSTVIISKPKVDEVDEQLSGHFLAEFANSPLGTDAAFINNLNGVTPQDQYEFGVEKNEKYYAPYNVLTYAYRGGTPMFTTDKTQSGDQLNAILIRDAITNDATNRLLNVFLKNDGRVPYNNAGIALFTGALQLGLQSFADKNLIEPNFEIFTVNADDVSENKKASGKLTGIGYKYTSVFNINDATISQTLVLPEQL